MGDFIVYLIPTDLTWQPSRDAAERTAAEARRRAGIPEHVYPSIEVEFFARITVAHPFENLERIGCPRCGGVIDVGWFDRLTDLNSPNPDGFDDLTTTVPCCGGLVSLADLDYDWPAGFSRFRITLWNPARELTGDDLVTLSAGLGHELRLIHAHP
ncbi:hypothetical protein [Plantactinospora sp. DSM 117369]